MMNLTHKKSPVSLVLRRFLLLNKRLLKKPSFIAILLLIPILALALNVFAKGESGAVTIALAQRDKNDSYASELIEYLTNNTALISYRICENANEALELVTSGKVDEAWIIRENSEELMRKFSENHNKVNALVDCINREDNALLKIAREKLYSVLFAKCTVPVYLNFISESAPELEGLSDAELMEYYETVNVDKGLFEYSYSDSNTKMEPNTDYVTAPFRGLCAVCILLMSLSLCIVGLQDEKSGVFLQMPKSQRPFFALCYQTSGLVLAAVFAVCSIAICGVSVGFFREVLCMLLYIFSCAGFCIILSKLIPKIGILSTLIPIIVIAVTLLCPVFINLAFLSPVSHIFPTYYYLRSVKSDSYILYSAIYAVSVCALSLIPEKGKR